VKCLSKDLRGDETIGLSRWVKEAGGSVSSPEGIEVSPLVSYGGEGLDQLCKGKTFQSSLDGALQVKC